MKDILLLIQQKRIQDHIGSYKKKIGLLDFMSKNYFYMGCLFL